MARRSKERDSIIPHAFVACVAVASLLMLSPHFRQVMFHIGSIRVLFPVLAIIGICIYKFALHPPSANAGGIERQVNLPRGDHAVSRTTEQARCISLKQLLSIDWYQFEKLVGILYGRLGYIVTRRGGANPDGGIDLVIEKEGIRSAVQCKQWKNQEVGVRVVREFLGALTDSGIQKGIMITLTGYTHDASELAAKHGIEIMDAAGVVAMAERSNAISDPAVVRQLNDTQKICPKCESPMVIRTTRRGENAGNKFWGCSTYPRCNFKLFE